MIPGIISGNKKLKAVSEISRKEMASLMPFIRKLVILDVDNVEPQFLPFLAAWFRVEYWDTSWTVAQQREKVKGALAVFRKLGTPAAVKETLAFLTEVYGYPLSLTEWFDMKPEGTRGTFLINTDTGPDGFVMDDAFYEKLFAGVERNKRGSQHWGFRIQGSVSGKCYAGSYLYSSEFCRVISNE